MITPTLPRASGYLRKVGVRFTDPGLTDFHCACILAEEAFTDEELTAAGTVDFGTGPVDQRDGEGLIRELDRLLRVRPQKRRAAAELYGADFEALKAFFGSRGVKASKLVTDDEFWTVAGILWPPHFADRGKRRLADLLKALRGMTKAQRKAANANLHLVPEQYRAGGSA